MEVNDAEEIVKYALMAMKKEKKIADFIHSKRNGELDEKGIDFLVITNNSKLLAIQVKTSSNNNNDDRKLGLHLKKHPQIKFVIFVKVNLYCKNKEEGLNHIINEIEGFLKE